MLLVQPNIEKPKPVSSTLVGSDVENALPIRDRDDGQWLEVAGLSWLLLDGDYRL